MMEKTLVILKPCTLQRGLVGEIINRFERKGLRLAGMKMVQLTDEVLSEHYFLFWMYPHRLSETLPWPLQAAMQSLSFSSISPFRCSASFCFEKSRRF